MGKGKQKEKENKEKKFDRNVEISAPILDPEIIKQIHTPPKGQRLDIKHGGFKALLSDLNSQDSTDELMPLNDNHMPSYIGISCAVSGYANYSSYNKRSSGTTTPKTTNAASTPNRSRTASPITKNKQLDHNHHPQVHHITIDRNDIHSAVEERKELTEKLTASAQEHRRSPSPCIQPTEDDRHHGAYVGARYCPLPPPSKVVNKHIPLLGIDDEQDPDEVVEEENKVEQKIASLYGDEFVEDWRESMTHKAKKELACDQDEQQQELRSPKDLVTLKPAPVSTGVSQTETKVEVDVPTPNVKVLAGVDKQFLNRLLTDENPPTPLSQIQQHVTIATNAKPILSPPQSPARQLEEAEPPKTETIIIKNEEPKHDSTPEVTDQRSPTPVELDTRPMSAESGEDQSVIEVEPFTSSLQGQEEHIEYEIRAESPVDNTSSPVRAPHTESGQLESIGEVTEKEESAEQNLVSFSPDPEDVEPKELKTEDPSQKANLDQVIGNEDDLKTSSEAITEADGHHYLKLLELEMSFINEQIVKAEKILEEKESELDEDTVGRVRSAIGKANLLVNKKCNQFKELCDANINKSTDGQFATLNDDLAGFWDMLGIQVIDVRKSFETLFEVQESNWKSSGESAAAVSDPIEQETDSQQQQQQQEELKKEEAGESRSKDKGSCSNRPKLSAKKDRKRREKLQEHINQMKQNQVASKQLGDNNLFEEDNSLVSTCNLSDVDQ